MNNPKAKDNLKPFKKGTDGRRNLEGRPKLPDISEAIAKILAEEKDGHSALETVLMALRLRAVKGDVRAAQELLDRAYGKSQQKIDHTTDGEKITKFTIEIVGGED